MLQPKDGFTIAETCNCYILLINHILCNKVVLDYKFIYLYIIGDRGGTVVKVLCYKSEGRWFDSRRCHWNFSLT